MKTLAPLIIAALWVANPSVRGENVRTVPVAVFDFESKEESLVDVGPQVSSLLSTALSNAPGIVTVERADLGKVLGEQELSLSGTVSNETAVKVGQLTGAKVLITGRVFHSGQEIVLVAKIISTETSRVFGETVHGPHGSVAELSEELGKKLSDVVTQNAAMLAPDFVSPDESLNKLRESLGARKRPSVRVAITERNFGDPVIDPAAETEIGAILQRCGFKLIDVGASEIPDVEISGEAFSAFGMRKGNLVSCRARIELKALKRGGALVTVDRQTSVAVDLTEQTAAKTALQNAATELAVRVLPRLVD